MDIGVGDWVECVDDSRIAKGPVDDWLPSSWPTAGCLYRVTDIVDAESIRGIEIGVELAEFREVDPDSGYAVLWAISRFRPLYRPNESLIRSLLEPRFDGAPVDGGCVPA